MQSDPRSTETEHWAESSLPLPWLVAPLVSVAVVLVMVGLAAVLWPHPTARGPGGLPSQPASSTPR